MVDGKEFLLVDTPGFNDTWKDFKRSDARILGEIAQTLTLQTQLGVPLVRRIPPRLTSPPLVDLRLARHTLLIRHNQQTDDRRLSETIRTSPTDLWTRGLPEREYMAVLPHERSFFDYLVADLGIQVLLVTTNWPQRYEDQLKQQCAVRERDLRREFWKNMIEGGSDMCRFDDHHATAKAIIRRLASKPDITLALQSELAEGKSLKRTRAFSFIVKLRQRDEAVLRVAEENGVDAHVNAEGVAIRKDSETRLNDDIVERVRLAIEEEEEAAKKQRRKLSVKGIFRWLVGLTHIALQAAQVGLSM